MRALAMIVVLVVAVVALPLQGASQPIDEVLRSLEREVQALKEGQARMQRDLQEIKSLLLRAREAARVGPPSEPQNLTLAIADAPILGDRNAKLVLMDFSDYQ